MMKRKHRHQQWCLNNVSNLPRGDEIERPHSLFATSSHTEHSSLVHPLNTLPVLQALRNPIPELDPSSLLPPSLQSIYSPAHQVTSLQIPRASIEPPPSLLPPFSEFQWHEIGLRYVPPQPILNPYLDSSNRIKIRFGTDFQAILCTDGSYQGNKSSHLYNQGGCGFICHLLQANETWVAARTLPKSDPNNSAPVAEAEGTVMGLEFLASKNISRALIIHDNYVIHAFICNKSKSKKKCSRYAKLKDRIVLLMSNMEAAYGCHVRSHQTGDNGLAENEIADQLASLFMKFPQLDTLSPMLLPSVGNITVSIINAFKVKYGHSWNIFTSDTFPIKASPCLPAATRCDDCGCPSHRTAACFMRRHAPSMSAFPREKPKRLPGFCESFLDPSSINWDNAPNVMDDFTFVMFLGTMFSLLVQESHVISAWDALISLSEYYYFSPHRSKLVKKKPKINQDSDGPCFDPNIQLHSAEKEAKRLHTFATIAHDRKWGRAMNFVHKTERINPIDPRLEHEWDAIHPQPLNPEDELNLDYKPSTFSVFDVDRYELSKKIDSWDVTKAAGLSGFPPSFLIHFNNLTAKFEDAEHPNPYFTSFVIFMKHLSSGTIPQLQQVAINYKGSFLNKVPANMGFKVRNLGMSDTFHRLAAYSVLNKSIPMAEAVGLLNEFDLGSGKLGGIEKFVKIAQSMAECEDIVMVSSDIEKAYNNILRSDTWSAIQEINFAPLTQWFIYAYGSSPWVNYIVDLNLPARGNNVRRVQLKIGFPQGDNLSGFLFSITLRYVLKEYFASLAASRIVFGFATVLDDTILAFNKRNTNKIGQHVEDFIHRLSCRNLKINTHKSIAFCKTIDLNLITQIRRKVPTLSLTNDGFDVCKIPIGTSRHIQRFIDTHYVPKIEEAYDNMLVIWKALQYLTNQERYNTFYIFLRLCFASKFAYWIRNLLPLSAHPISLIIDSKIEALTSKLYPQLPSNITFRQPEFIEMKRLSSMIETLPLTLNGAGITRLNPIVPIGHFSTCAESFQVILDFATLVGIQYSAVSVGVSYADQIRSMLLPSLESTITHLVTVCSAKMSIADFAIQPKKEYRGVQKAVSTAFYHTLLDTISRELPNDAYRAWFTSRKDSFTSLTLNSSVRHVTGKRPPLDGVFPVVLSMRTLQPIFHLYSCGCGEVSDVCGLHLLKCRLASPSPFVRVHNNVRDATVRAFQDYLRRNSPSHLHAFSETQKFHLCEVSRYYPTAMNCENHRVDAIVFEDHDPFHPFLIDFVQAQIDEPEEDRVMCHLNTAYRLKIAALVRDHIGIPRQSIIPMAFASNGVFHPASLLFVDWFLCRGAHKPLMEPPAMEKLKCLHAMTSAIVDSTASLLSEHFLKFIHSLHHRSFPFVLSQGAAELTLMRHGRRARSNLAISGHFDVSPHVATAGPSTDRLPDSLLPSAVSAASSPSVNSRGTLRSRVNYKALATVGRTDS
jgi:ribonuclease HI